MDTQTICSLFFKIGGIKTKGNINFGYPLYTDCFFNFEFIKYFSVQFFLFGLEFCVIVICIPISI